MNQQAWLSVRIRGTLVLLSCWRVGETGAGRELQDLSEQRSRAMNQGGMCRKHRQLDMARAWCVCGVGVGSSSGRWNPSVMLKDPDFILKAMGSYWKVLNIGTTKSISHLGKTTLTAVQMRSKGKRQGNSLGGCFNSASEILI